MANRNALLVFLTLAAVACGPSENEPGPGGVTVGEARALDEAAEMIEERRLPPDAFQPGQTAEPPETSSKAEPRAVPKK